MSQPWPPTSEEARAQLEEANRPTLTSARDRHVHAAALAVLGVSIGLFVAITVSLDIPSTAFLITIVVVYAAAAAVYIWRAKAAGTKPLTSQRLEKRAGVTMAVVGGIALNVDLAVGGDDSWWIRTLLGLAYGAPYCVAALLVLRTRR